ncbi:IS5 family transposase [Streptomyces mirabilis]|uniref:IS5 family transposase n=1 Tax=Streptomyces mirabilis TaxID=68239 RepID=UPI00367D82B0
MPVSNNRCGRWRDQRQVINGIIHRIGTGVQWRELPERFGLWKTVHKRHLLWSADGTWEMLLQHVEARADADGGLDWNVEIISSARAHHPAAPAGGGRAPGEALGRSRSWLTTKIHVVAEGRCRPLTLLITPGQRADCAQFELVMDKIRVPRKGIGRPRRTPDSVGTDKAYSNRKIRTYLRKRGIRHAIPEKTDHKAARLRRGSRGGRPPGFDKDRYKDRNTVERAIGKLKQFRAVAARYDKRGYVNLGTVTDAALLIWLRS